MRNNPNLVLLKVNRMQNLIKFCWFVNKIFSGNKVLTITKGHNCVVYLQKLMPNNPNQDLVNNNAYAILGYFYLFIHKILSRNKIWTIIMGHYITVLQICESWPVTIPTKIWLWLRSKDTQNFIKFHQFIHKILTRNSDNNQGPYLCCIFAKIDA